MGSHPPLSRVGRVQAEKHRWRNVGPGIHTTLFPDHRGGITALCTFVISPVTLRVAPGWLLTDPPDPILTHPRLVQSVYDDHRTLFQPL